MGDRLRSTASMTRTVAYVMGLLALGGALVLADAFGAMLGIVAFTAAVIPLVPYIGIAHLLEGTAELVDAAEKPAFASSPANGLEPLEEGTPHGYYPDPGTPGQMRWWDGRGWDSMTKPEDN